MSAEAKQDGKLIGEPLPELDLLRRERVSQALVTDADEADNPRASAVDRHTGRSQQCVHRFDDDLCGFGVFPSTRFRPL